MKKTFAEKFWRQFELLALEYIHEQYKDQTVQCIHTSFINDGGYDGSISYNLTRDDAPFVHEVLNLIEAKLRTESNITIHDFAASIIAAYNFSAHILYVVSNTNFTKSTREITDTFSHKVNLQIVLIDGSLLLNWLNSKPNEKDSFIIQLIDSIQKNSDHNNTDTTFKSHRHSNHLPKAENNIFIDNQYFQYERLFGGTIRDVEQNAVNILEETDRTDRTILLVGAIGTGKSAVIRNIGYTLQKKDFIFSILESDVEDALSVRSVFLWVLKSLWGIDPFKIYTSENISEYIDYICFTTGTFVEPNIKETIRQLFLINDNSYSLKSDLYITFLLRYLNIILQKRKGNNRTVIAFKDLHCLGQPVLDFVISLIRCLISNNVGIILEISPLDKKVKARNDWETGRKALLRFEQYGHKYELFDFNDTEAKEFLSVNLPGVSKRYYEYMLTHIGLKPAFLSYAIKWLNINKVIEKTPSSNYYTVAKPDEFFDGLTPDQNIRIIEDIIRYYQTCLSENQDIIIELFEVIKLLDGKVSYILISQIYSSDYIKKAIQTLLSTGLFMRTSEGVSINHDLVLSALSNTSYSYYQLCAAHKIYSALDIVEDMEFVRCKKADMLLIMQHWDEFFSLAVQIGEDAFKWGEYAKSIKYFSLCREHIEKPKNTKGISLAYVMYKELLTYEKMGRSGSAQNLFGKYQEELLLEKRRFKNETPVYFLALQKLFLARLADKEKQYSVAGDMLNYAKSNYEQIPRELYVSICFVYALIEKKYVSLNSTIDFLDNERKLLPDSIELNIEYESHMAAKYLNSNPKEAIAYYKRIVEYSGNAKKYAKSIGHARVDILTCYLLSEDWTGFEQDFSEVLEYLETNALYGEQGRLYNLDGLYYWINNKLSDAYMSFQESQFFFGLTHNKMNGLIARINYIGLLIAQDKIDEALLEFSVAQRNISKIYGALFSQISITKHYRKHREYATLLMLLKYGCKLKQTQEVQHLIDTIDIAALSEHLNQLIHDLYPKEVFKDTCIIHNGIVTLTR